MGRYMTLDEARIDTSYIVEKIDLPLDLERRMEALGMIAGTRVHVMNTKSHGTLILKVRGTRFALGKGISGNIRVREVQP